ncbi:putative secreted protein with PEP-CTERM sorting signal [Pseudoduganella flava]|uniref:PEP-CTERM sorting domain-containing protein n=1 Tax=Pseudoduganella flava TaxID=871742 RepID=A0A562P7E5_9BURK|nr:PEP-CTERM sorting domain-containing protein [Pseudoduganella flava]QGZ40763.1 PEP-CTERM sorting domain-containing protein [Pseudoduganella flava]TWI40372.1 putative secreted protein with PEP-CTERM sorting signal [Pseudoduganella flava]
MKKAMGIALLASSAILAPLHAYAAQVDWVQWNSTGSAGSFSQGGVSIGVTANAQLKGVDYTDYYSAFPGTYLSAAVSNGPGTDGVLQFTGGSSAVHHISFSQAVVNPYIAIISLGQASEQASFDFVDVGNISLISSGPGNWGNGMLRVEGGSVIGEEGSGVIRLSGTFTDLYFTTPVYEDWYGMTVGVAAAVPEPGTWGMLAAGGAVLGLMGRRRRNDKLGLPR